MQPDYETPTVDAAAAFARRHSDGRNPATGLFDAHPLSCDCRQCVLDDFDPADGT